MASPQQPAADPQASQAGLAITLSSAIALLWPSLDLTNLSPSLVAFKAAIALEVQRHARAAATLAVGQYRRQRAAAGVTGAFTPVPADPPPLEQIASSVDWAVQPLWTPNVAAPAGAAPVSIPREAPSAGTAIADAKARLAASSERLVLGAGRDTVIDNVHRDRKAKGWARIPEPGACSFCLMLAARGATYQEHSFDRANARFVGQGDFKAHDHCRCHADPVFTAYEPSAEIRQAQQLWATSTRGLSGNAARIAFRRAVEGRTAPTEK